MPKLFAKKIMQAHIEHKAYNDQKANTSKLKQTDYVKNSQIIKRVNFHLRISGWLGRALLKNR